jgi:glyoxylase-like metal-dependent hydrolase (beta-lactamase superfamily II)
MIQDWRRDPCRVRRAGSTFVPTALKESPNDGLRPVFWRPAQCVRGDDGRHVAEDNLVSILEGSGGNIAVLTGSDGKVFIDAGITVSRRRILEAANALSLDPIRHLINTHWHFDHADGNEWLHAEGATIVAHENTHKHLLATQRVEDWDFNFPSSPLAAIPTEVFSSEN